MNNNSISASAVLGIALGLGLIIAGYFIGDALYQARASERYVEVKGLAERTVDADLAIWPLVVKVTDNDLTSLYKKIESQRSIIKAFLLEAGFKDSETSELPPRLMDAKAETYIDNSKKSDRYIATIVVSLRSTNVPLVLKTMESSKELVKRGVVLTYQDYSSSTDFLFTALNDIKPEMIAEATKNARAAAEQFAKDSGSSVGSIRNARQGLFTIQDSDMNTPYRKKIRVVTTVDYFLAD